ncbi:DegQ family serine endoprotease [Aurantimonas marianensis]|uniref:DegQ family serine endoprotease n=1 Tax=Aurantimonas marianensis TaxID=2920428 RepID=A0A9X2H5F8_9HYPH|nr:DegQ family serine endoprotease [Aurantimonas marianensis]
MPDAIAAETKTVPRGRAEIDLSFAPLVKETAPAVVNVYAARVVPTRRSPFVDDPFFGQFFGHRLDDRPRMESALGSGVIIDPSGLVVTNNHVVENADEVKIAFSDGREFETKVLLKDAKVDLAVLAIEGPGPFPSLPVADSDELEIGDLVLAIGNPFGIGQTVTTGIVSALARSHVGVNDFGFFIQTDAAINPGNSGGALIDMKGRLVGVNTAIFSRSGGSNGIGFAIPSNMVASFQRAAKAGGRFERPYVGATFASVTPDIADALGLSRPTGALVQAVTNDSPAAVAGITVGDVILSVDGFAIDNPDALGYRLATAGVGRTARMDVLRGDERESVELALEAAPEIPPRDKRSLSGNNPFSGATVLNLSPRVAEERGLPADKTGVVVVAVERGSLAQRFGLRPNDILLALNGDLITSTKSLTEMLKRRYRGWQFEVERDGRRMTQLVR